MNKAKIMSRYSVHVIDYDKEINPILKKKDENRNVEELLLIVKRKEVEDNKKAKLAEIETFKDFVTSAFNRELGEYDSPKPYYVEEGDAVVQKWEVISNDPVKIASKISSLKSELNGSDYKVMKCYEAIIAKSEEMPYNVDKLIESRQAKRDEINHLEALLKTTEPIDLQSRVAI